MAISAQYVGTVKAAAVAVSTVNTALTGAGSFDTVFTFGTNGSRIDDITIQATGTVAAANMLRFFIYNGTSHFLLKEVPINVGTSSQSSATTAIQLNNLAWCFPTGYVLKACVHATLTVNAIITRVGDF